MDNKMINYFIYLIINNNYFIKWIQITIKNKTKKIVHQKYKKVKKCKYPKTKKQ